MDTIYALASGRGKAGVAVIRVSGPRAGAAGEVLSGPLPPPRVAALRKIKGHDGCLLDEALVLFFESGHSFTGEGVVEFHVHGGIAIVRAVLARLEQVDGLRMAEPGEFTRRALENNRLDLTQVEGLADLIDAETESQRQQALNVVNGAVGRLADSWRDRLIRVAALVEATIDFADEDVPVDVTPEVGEILDGLIAEFHREIAGSTVSERIRDGYEVAIIGAPNAGKSSLLNVLAGRDAAITSSRAGTTRDVIEVRMDLGGLPVTLLDTAGLRSGGDEVEEIGIKRAIARAESADLRVLLLDGGPTPEGVHLNDDDIVVEGKADVRDVRGLAISSVTRDGIDILVDRIRAVLEKRSLDARTITRERHRLAVVAAVRALESARSGVLSGEMPPEIVAEDIRSALRGLDSLVGRIDVDHLLGEIFSSFCIGK